MAVAEIIIVPRPKEIASVTAGLQGPPGRDGAAIVLVRGEVPAGAINGSNATLTTAFDFVPESVELFVNGLAQRKTTDFHTSGARTIVLSESPTAGDSLTVNYQKG